MNIRFASILVAAALLSATSAPAPAQERTAAGALTPDAVTLRPGDVVRVTIWREGDLGGDFFVDEEGRLTLPLLGVVDVRDIPVREVREILTERYRQELRNPSIVITPMRRINVMGEVRRPGLYTLDPTISLAEAVALAGGAAETGDIRRISIIRHGVVVREEVSSWQSVDVADLRSGDQIIVGRRGWFERNTTFIVSMLVSVTGIAISILNRN